jgi:hypothetical protein
MKISQQEQRILTSLHLQGFVNWGAMKKNNRLQLLYGLTDKGLLDQNCRLTELDIKGGNLKKSKGHICFSDDLRFEYFIYCGMVYRTEADAVIYSDGYRYGQYFCPSSHYKNYKAAVEEKMALGHA